MNLSTIDLNNLDFLIFLVITITTDQLIILKSNASSQTLFASSPEFWTRPIAVDMTNIIYCSTVSCPR